MIAERTDVEIRRRLLASPREVFAAFTDPDLVRRWLSPSPEITLTVLQLDFRVGGTYRFAYRVPGGRTMVAKGTYRSIEPHSMIAFSWVIEPPDEHAGLHSEVMVSIEPDGEATQLIIRHVKLTQAGASPRHAQGWQGALDQLVALLGAAEMPK
jgi:uncharacterized protein YndB with AHSA1/START domain